MAAPTKQIDERTASADASRQADLNGRAGIGVREPARVMRIIARMNIGGPSYHVSLLGGRMNRERYSTLLVHGEVGPGEESFAGLAQKEGCQTEVVPSLGPTVSPARDLKALRELTAIVRRHQPHLVHTHTAKAGTLGRLAVLRARLESPPITVHTFHGHVLEGHFGRSKTVVYRAIERELAKRTDCLLGVSEATVDDLVRLGIAPRSKFRVIPLGLDLERFRQVSPADGGAFRAEAGARPEDVLMTCVCRVVPHKRADLPIRIVARLRESHPNLRLAIVGDGEHRPVLERLADDLEVRDRVFFAGYRHDVAPVAAAADIAILTSDSDEGTPVSLIEAAAANVPSIATIVGGVQDVVPSEAGILAACGDEDALTAAVERLSGDPALRERMGVAAAENARRRYAVERLLGDIESLYDELLGARRD